MKGIGRHDLAYACFVPPVLLGLVSAIGKAIPMSTGVAGGIGFLVLIPLSLLCLVSIPAGIHLAFRLRGDLGLVLLSVLTILVIVEVVTEAGSAAFYNAAMAAYAALGLVLVAHWFLVRRWRSARGRSPEDSLSDA